MPGSTSKLHPLVVKDGVAFGCKSRSTSDPGIGFHRFPSREENGGYRPLKERTGARRNGLEYVHFVTGLPTSTRNVVSRSIRVL